MGTCQIPGACNIGACKSWVSGRLEVSCGSARTGVAAMQVAAIGARDGRYTSPVG